jgi:cytochrome c biogenesis protein CcmG, thiol:disulfide interchange protein DsbE
VKVAHPGLSAVAIGAAVALVGFVAFAIVSATRSSGGRFPEAAAPSALTAGRAAPSFELSRLGGGDPVSFVGGAGSGPLVLNFFASWCPDCVAELGAFATVSRSETGVRFLGVDADDPSPAAAERLLRRAGVSYLVGTDRSGAVTDRYLVSALPVTFFIAPDGRILGEHFGAATAAELSGWVARLQRGRR